MHTGNAPIEVVYIEEVEAESTTQEDGQSPVLIRQGIGHGSCELGKSVTGYPFVFFFGIRYFNHLRIVFVPYYPVAIGINTGIFPGVIITQALSFFYALQLARLIRTFHIRQIVIVLSGELVVGEFEELVLIGGAYQIDGIAEIFHLHCLDIQIDFNTGVAHGTYIDKSGREQVRRNGHIVVAQQILLLTVVVIDRTAQYSFKHAEVHADVPVFTFFPFQPRIRILTCTPYSEVLTVVVVTAETAHGRQRQVITEILITGYTVVTTYFQVINPCDVFHESFFADTPTGRYSGEITPFIVISEAGRTFVSQRSGHQVAVFVVIAQTAEESNQFRIAFVGTHFVTSFFLGPFTGTEVVVQKSVGREILIGGIQT